ncbi:hypothetical protein HY212_02450 [Candidatus Pacearchaeota archaeon]|nr:hypothetical protein [Candidatus Pacearchaeota archaeon]
MIIKATPDKEKVKSILKLTNERENFVRTIDHERFSTNAAENYYEIVKELSSVLILLDGLKAVGENAHKDLIDCLRNYKSFSGSDIVFINDLRIKRNNSSYDGKKIDPSYLRNNKSKIIEIIEKLKKAVQDRLVEE